MHGLDDKDLAFEGYSIPVIRRWNRILYNRLLSIRLSKGFNRKMYLFTV